MLAAIGACAGPAIPPRVEVERVAFATFAFPVAQARILVCVINPNDRRLTATGADLSLALDGRAVATGSSGPIALPPAGAVTIPFDVTLDEAAALAAATHALGASTLHYAVAGRIRGAGLFGGDIDFAKSGDVTGMREEGSFLEKRTEKLLSDDSALPAPECRAAEGA